MCTALEIALCLAIYQSSLCDVHHLLQSGGVGSHLAVLALLGRCQPPLLHLLLHELLLALPLFGLGLLQPASLLSLLQRRHLGQHNVVEAFIHYLCRVVRLQEPVHQEVGSSLPRPWCARPQREAPRPGVPWRR